MCGRVVVASVLAMGMAVAPTAMADAGVDVSNWQGCVSSSGAATAKANGTSFAFIKATEGTNFVDRTCDCSLQHMKAAGIRLGVYHFARPASNPGTAGAIREADWFIAHTRGYVGQGIIPVLDWEPSGSWRAQTAWAKTWLDRVAAAWGTKPLIYMSASTIKAGDWRAVAGADYGLWVAGYPRGYAGDKLRNPGAPPYPVSPWPFAAAWQYSSSGNVPGIGSAVDVNWFYGDAVTWAKYGNAKLPANPTPAPTPQHGAPVGDVDTLAQAVLRGEYGNLPQRKALLGDRYAEVQARVNQLIAGNSSGGGSASRSVTVRAGDTMSAIAVRTGLLPASAWSVPSGNINKIWPGQVVTYRGATTSGGTGGRTVTVRAGDTLSGIAARLGIGVGQLTGYRSGNPNIIYPGEVLRY